MAHCLTVLCHRHSCRLRDMCRLVLVASHVTPNDRNAIYALRRFCVRRRPRACHGACDRLRPGRLRASHAVCLRYSTLESTFCARKEESNNESVSTSERIMNESFPMRSLNQGFRLDSLHLSSVSLIRSPATFPDGFRSEVTANNGAAENCSGRQRVSRWLLPAEPAAVSELESLGVLARIL